MCMYSVFENEDMYFFPNTTLVVDKLASIQDNFGSLKAFSYNQTQNYGNARTTAKIQTRKLHFQKPSYQKCQSRN